ncbi:UreD urease accessory protein-domain-containing protein [Flagelloscypha sp. PMI_526]|nr:UreD urease accessory protein-domain-containing protein [Flagelloscypha sp. PMI_526]
MASPPTPETGRISVGAHANQAKFTELSCTYPLKLLSPRVPRDRLAVAYIMSYGGGLVGGDYVHLNTTVQDNAVLLLLSQGSTKVFKQRPFQRLSSATSQRTTQRLHFELQDVSTLLLLPDAVTCFSGSSYDQIQSFNLSPTSSLVLLDWVTSGRKSRGENWDFERYCSFNEVFIGGQRVARDSLLLEQPRLKERMAGYSCFAMLFLFGDTVKRVVEELEIEYAKISLHASTKPPTDDVIWSMSVLPLPSSTATFTIIRIAGFETERVRQWIGTALQALEEIVGIDIYQKTFF